MRGLLTELRYAGRSLRRTPAFSAVAIVTLALGIGAAAVVYAVVKTVLINPLPYGNADRLVTVVETDGRTPNPATVSVTTAQDWMRRTEVLDRLALWGDSGVRPIVDGRADQVRGMRVTADFFETLGVPMFLGRPFRNEDDAPGRRNLLILTYDTWMTEFGGDPGLVGRAIPTVDGTFIVIGILPAGFHPLHMSNPAELPRVFLLMARDDGRDPCRSPACRSVRAIGRLAPGTTSAQANAGLNAVMRTLVREHPDYPRDARAIVTPLRDELVGSFGASVWMLEASALALLILACVNLATLLLARAVARQADAAIRAALGAGRARLIRHALTECAILAATAAAGGVALAWIVTRVIARTGDPNIPRIGELAPDKTMLVFGVGAAAVTALLFGVIPAVIGSRRAFDALRGGRSVISRRSHQTAIRTLIAAELSFAFLLVLVVGLLSKSYVRLMDVDPGFDPQHVLTVSLLPGGPQYQTPADHVAYFDAVADRARTIATVQDAAYASTLPLSHPSAGPIYIREHPAAADSDAPNLDTYLVSTNYLDVMTIPVVRGRRFLPSDTHGSARVAVISESAARTQFPGEDAIGQHIQIRSRDDTRPWAVIVGVVGDVHQYGLERAPDAAVYMPFGQIDPPFQGWASLVVRTTGSAERIEPQVRAAMEAVDPLQPVFHMQPMTTYISLSVSQRTFALMLIAAFGALALMLATGGVYGVVSYLVEQRTREVGLRLALGATPGIVRRMIVRQVLAIALTGVGGGLIAAAVLTRGLSTLLFGVTRFDLPTLCGVAFTLIATALAAGAVPVVRASRVDPVVALRAD